ncbi:MAG TPA: hypothetical protein VKU00_27695, partial [Chthonomonadaceae bacterium]|nr:hypothetical protein [Chthonomonadaceae bacterium]
GALLLLLLAVPALSLRAIAALEEPKPLPPTPLPAETALPLPAPMEDPPATRRAETSTGGPPSTPAGPALRAIHPGSAPSENLQAAAPPQPGVGAAPLPAGKAPEMQTLAWGPVVDGLQTGLRLVTPKTSYAPGETIEQEVYLRNRTKSDVFVTASGGYEEQGAPVVTDAKGGKVKVLNFYGEGLYYMVSTRVRAGEMGLVGRFTLAFRAPEKGEDSPKEVAPGLSSWAEGMPLALARTGTYVLRQDIIPMGADEKTPKKTVPTGSIPIRIAGKPAAIIPVDHNRIADLATAPITWGPERSGLQAGLLYVGQKSRYYVGERVRLAVVLRNVSAHPISFWHETSFASLEPPNVLDAAGKKIAVPFAAEPEWRTLGEIRMSGVTFDMTYAPSADGPSRLRQSEIKPGQSVIGYYLTAFVIPPKWSGGLASPGRYRVVQPIRLGLGDAEQLDTTLETGNLDLEIYDPDAKQ